MTRRSKRRSRFSAGFCNRMQDDMRTAVCIANRPVGRMRRWLILRALDAVRVHNMERALLFSLFPGEYRFDLIREISYLQLAGMLTTDGDLLCITKAGIDYVEFLGKEIPGIPRPRACAA